MSENGPYEEPRPGVGGGAAPGGGSDRDGGPVPAEPPAPDPPPAGSGPAAGPYGHPPDASASGPEAEPAYRLSPLTLVTAPVNYLRSYIVPVLIAVIAGTYSFNPWMLGGAGVALVAMVLSGLLTWYTLRYQVGSESLEIRRGLINRSRRSIPLERIRGVDISSNPLHRMLGLAVVKIEAAAGGGGSEEGKLDAVAAGEAERLRR
ncbi:PH domain-containing protein, partial [Streptomonospora salina]